IVVFFFFFQAEDGIRDFHVTGVQTCALPICCDTLAKFAAGLADDLLSTLYLATKAPVWVAPAMNQQMWAAKATQRNLATLIEDGVHVIMPDAGSQAWGEVGLGRMPEPEELAHQVTEYFHKAQRASG